MPADIIASTYGEEMNRQAAAQANMAQAQKTQLEVNAGLPQAQADMYKAQAATQHELASQQQLATQNARFEFIKKMDFNNALRQLQGLQPIEYTDPGSGQKVTFSNRMNPQAGQSPQTGQQVTQAPSSQPIAPPEGLTPSQQEAYAHLTRPAPNNPWSINSTESLAQRLMQMGADPSEVANWRAARIKQTTDVAKDLADAKEKGAKAEDAERITQENQSYAILRPIMHIDKKTGELALNPAAQALTPRVMADALSLGYDLSKPADLSRMLSAAKRSGAAKQETDLTRASQTQANENQKTSNDTARVGIARYEAQTGRINAQTNAYRAQLEQQSNQLRAQEVGLKKIESVEKLNQASMTHATIVDNGNRLLDSMYALKEILPHIQGAGSIVTVPISNLSEGTIKTLTKQGLGHIQGNSIRFVAKDVQDRLASGLAEQQLDVQAGAGAKGAGTSDKRFEEVKNSVTAGLNVFGNKESAIKALDDAIAFVYSAQGRSKDALKFNNDTVSGLTGGKAQGIRPAYTPNYLRHENGEVGKLMTNRAGQQGYMFSDGFYAIDKQ